MPLAPMILGLLLIPGPSAEIPTDVPPLVVTVRAGRSPRLKTPIRFEVAEDRIGAEIRSAMDRGPSAIEVRRDGESSTAGVAQAERVGEGGRVRITWILAEEIPAEGSARFRFGGLARASTRWAFDESKPGALGLKQGDRPVFCYNAAPVSSPKYQAIQDRDAYLHPAYSPSGALVTGDFSPSHPHHRGFFLAYEKTKVGDLAPDFWNIHYGTGKIHSEGFDRPVVGPLTARFSTRHRWDAVDKSAGRDLAVLRERWEVEAYDIPGASTWLFDLTSTQQAIDRPLEILPYRYGGMAYRGPEPFVKGTLDVLTSEGLHRKDGDQKIARWVDLTGPVADGSDQYAGAMIADHPTNPLSPTVARIHPTTLPFFCFVPAYSRPLTLRPDTPTVFRYRVLIHDGHPDPALDSRIARDFAEPPTVVVD